MPRVARIKSPDHIYHIMSRSINEIDFFRDDEDKEYFLDLLKKYKEKYCCRIFAYCLMNSHYHLHIDPNGFDISKFMHSLNISYVIYYNKKYNRHGHLLQERFDSRVVSTDKYNLAVSAYIHNNPKDILKFKGNEHEYPYSSMGIYLGKRPDKRDLVDISFILGILNIKDSKKTVQKYLEFVYEQTHSEKGVKFSECLDRVVINTYRNDREVLYRDFKPMELIEKISVRLGICTVDLINYKSHKTNNNYRSICAFTLRYLCGSTYKDLCKILFDMSLSGIVKLCNKGYDLINQQNKYKNLFMEIIKV